MKLTYLIIFFLFNCLCLNLVAQTIATVNIQSLIDNNANYIATLNKIEKNQDQYLEIFDLKEKELKEILDNIEESKLILSQSEINIRIDNYNNQLTEFNFLIEEFNFHYQNQIINIREQVLREIIILLENYAIENKVDLILDSTSYLIASNSIDITEFINGELTKINFILEYESFKKN